MKTPVILSIFFLLWISLTAKTPQAFKYQAVARNSSGEVLSGSSWDSNFRSMTFMKH